MFASEGEEIYDLWDYYLSSPKEHGGIIYWGCGDGHLYAINPDTGELVWKYQTGGVVHASPVFHEDAVLIGGFDGYFYSISKTTGSLNWKFKTVGATYFPVGEIQKAALIKDGVAYFGSRDYNMYAIDVKSGRGRWNIKQPRGWIIAAPIEHKGKIYFGTSDAHIFLCMDKNNGQEVWQKKLSMRVYGSAIVKDDVIYFGTFDGKLYGVDHSSGETQWEFQTESSKLNYSTMYNEEGDFKEGFELYGSGYEKSEQMIHALGSILSTPVIAGEVIYFGSSDGNLYAFNLN